MTPESKAQLLLAYRYAIMADQDGISDLLEDVILAEMSKEEPPPIVVGGSRTTTEPPWKVTCGPDVVPLGGTRAVWMEANHLSKEVTA